jgi:DNA-binding NarL/FixJ family response regulator
MKTKLIFLILLITAKLSCSQIVSDWVLMDIKMNKTGAITATHEIKNKHPDAKIISVSQCRDKAFINEAIKAGVVDLINKKDLSTIKTIIREC